MDDNDLLHYLNILHKLNSVSKYIENITTGSQLLPDITNCKHVCVNNIKSHQLITTFLNEETSLTPSTSSTSLSNEPELITPTPIKEEDVELKDQIDTLANLLGNTLDTSNTDTNTISPQQFDTFGSGLARLFKPDIQALPIPKVNSQIKNELNLSNSNINFQIKKKYEQ